MNCMMFICTLRRQTTIGVLLNVIFPICFTQNYRCQYFDVLYKAVLAVFKHIFKHLLLLYLLIM